MGASKVLLGFVFASLTFASPDRVDGVWQSEGYGYALEIQGPLLRAFEITASTCVPGFTARRNASTFVARDGAAYAVRSGASEDVLLLRPDEAVSDIRFRRSTRLPAVCERPAPNTPTGNFEVFARTWSEHYISFERRRMNWNAIVGEYQKKVDANTTPTALFEIFEAMIRPLRDLHTYLEAPGIRRSTKQFWQVRTERILKGDVERFAARRRWELFRMTDGHLMTGTRKLCNGGLHFGHISRTMGYLRIRSFGSFAKHDDRRGLENCLDSIFGDGDLRSLVLDMRLSFGGSDELALAIAARLTDHEYVAYHVQARLANGNWTPRQEVVVRPSARPGFRGPIALLTGPVTMSAAESFVLSLMGRGATVLRIGESTQGVFCDVLNRHLPNGWTFGLPNAQYLTEDGRSFEATGIPPDIAAPVYADADVTAGKDPALSIAIRELSH